MRIEMDQGNEQIDFGGAWQTLIFWICNFDFANPPMASRLQATAKSAGMHMAAAEAGDLGDFCTDFVRMLGVASFALDGSAYSQGCVLR